MAKKSLEKFLLRLIKDEMKRRSLTPYQLSVQSGVKLGSIVKLLAICSCSGNEPFQVHATTLIKIMEFLDVIDCSG